MRVADDLDHKVFSTCEDTLQRSQITKETYGPFLPPPRAVDQAATGADVATLAIDVSESVGRMATRSTHSALTALGAVGGIGILAYGIYQLCTDKEPISRVDAACSAACGLETLGYVGQSMGKFAGLSGVLAGLGAIGGGLQIVLGATDMYKGIKNHNHAKTTIGLGNALAGVAWILASTGVALALTGPAVIALNLATVAYQERGAIKSGLRKLVNLFKPAPETAKTNAGPSQPIAVQSPPSLPPKPVPPVGTTQGSLRPSSIFGAASEDFLFA